MKDLEYKKLKQAQTFYNQDYWGVLSGPDIKIYQAGSISSGQLIRIYVQFSSDDIVSSLAGRIYEECGGANLVFVPKKIINIRAQVYGGPYLIIAAGYFCEFVLNKNLKDVISSLNTESKMISILLNETDFAEYDREKNHVFIHEKNRLAIGESLKHNDRYYFYQSDNNKYFYTNLGYINPANFKIVSNSNLYKLEYNQNLIWTEDDINKNEILIRDIDINKKIALFLQHFNSERKDSSKIEEESCINLLVLRSSLKKSLCKIAGNINLCSL